MLAIFCLRLGCGMITALCCLPMDQIHPRFFRIHFLISVGLLAMAAVFLHGQGNAWLWLALGAGLVLLFLGSIVWNLEGAPGGLAIIVFSVPTLVLTLGLAGQVAHRWGNFWGTLADDLTSAALLGSAATAMLVSHSYLFPPSMTMTPLFRMLKILGICLLIRMVLAGSGLWFWSEQIQAGNPQLESWLWLPFRWGLGFMAPLVLGWMAWESARIRSTQSATGILYVMVIVCFLGELTSQMLLDMTGYIL